MADNKETLPVEHGFGSSAAITAAESGKGLITGAGGGALRGAMYGALAVGGICLAGMALFNAGIGMTVLALLAGGGALVGAVIGAPVGAAVGTVHGFGEGTDRVARDSAAVQMARSQEKTAEAQTETAKALQAKVIERMSQAQPVITASTVQHQGQGMAQAPQQGIAGGSIAQRIQQQQLAAASAEQQV